MSDAPSVTTLHPAPDGRHPDCEFGCSAESRGALGPCSHQCAKTPEFAEQLTRDGNASRAKFYRKLVGLREVKP